MFLNQDYYKSSSDHDDFKTLGKMYIDRGLMIIFWLFCSVRSHFLVGNLGLSFEGELVFCIMGIYGIFGSLGLCISCRMSGHSPLLSLGLTLFLE